MSLQPFIPTPKFEEYKETFKDYYMLERQTRRRHIGACTYAQQISVQLSVENHRSVGQLFKTIGADPKNEVMIFSGSGPDFHDGCGSRGI